MPHKYTTEQTITTIKEQIGKLDREIASIRSISKRDKEGMDVFIDRLKKLLESAAKKKDMALDGTMEDGNPRYLSDGSRIPAQLLESKLQEKMALIFRGQETAFQAIVDMFENSAAAVDIFVMEREEKKRELDYYSKMEVRENNPT